MRRNKAAKTPSPPQEDRQKWFEKRRTIAHKVTSACDIQTHSAQIAQGNSASREDFLLHRTSEHMDEHLVHKALEVSSQHQHCNHESSEEEDTFSSYLLSASKQSTLRDRGVSFQDEIAAYWEQKDDSDTASPP